MAEQELKLAELSDVKDKSEAATVKDSTDDTSTEAEEEAASSLALKLERLTVTCSARGKAHTLTTEEKKALARKSAKLHYRKARDGSAGSAGKAKSSSEDRSSRVFGDDYSQSLDSFAKISLEANFDTEKDQAAEPFQSHSRLSGCAGKRKRSTTPETELAQNPNLRTVTCGEQVRLLNDINPDDLAGYLEVTTFFPKKMSYMAELMYT